MNYLPVRPLIKYSSGDGAWIIEQKAEQRRQFKAIICALKNQTDDNIKKYTTSEKTNENQSILFSKNFILDTCKTIDPNKVAVIKVDLRHLYPSNETFGEFTSVYKIQAAGNFLNMDSFVSFHWLTDLNLSSNNLKNVIIEPHDFVKLEILNVSFNELTVEDVRMFGLLKNLKVLSLCGNDLNHLPAQMNESYVDEEGNSVFRYSELVELNLEKNNLSSEETFSSLGGLQNLRVLKLAHNRISSIPLLRCIYVTDVKSPENVYQLYPYDNYIDFDEGEEISDVYLEMSKMEVRIPSTLQEVDEESIISKIDVKSMKSSRFSSNKDEESKRQIFEEFTDVEETFENEENNREKNEKIQDSQTNILTFHNNNNKKFEEHEEYVIENNENEENSMIDNQNTFNEKDKILICSEIMEKQNSFEIKYNGQEIDKKEDKDTSPTEGNGTLSNTMNEILEENDVQVDICNNNNIKIKNEESGDFPLTLSQNEVIVTADEQKNETKEIFNIKESNNTSPPVISEETEGQSLETESLVLISDKTKNENKINAESNQSQDEEKDNINSQAYLIEKRDKSITDNFIATSSSQAAIFVPIDCNEEEEEDTRNFKRDTIVNEDLTMIINTNLQNQEGKVEEEQEEEYDESSNFDKNVLKIQKGKLNNIIEINKDLAFYNLTDVIKMITMESRGKDSFKPFPVLEFLDLSHNRIKEEKGIIPVISWINLSRLSINDNPLTLTKSQKSSFIKEMLENTFKIIVDWLPPIQNDKVHSNISRSRIDVSDTIPNFPQRSFRVHDLPTDRTSVDKEDRIALPQLMPVVDIINQVRNNGTKYFPQNYEAPILAERKSLLDIEQELLNDPEIEVKRKSKSHLITALKHQIDHPITYFDRKVDLFKKQENISTKKNLLRRNEIQKTAIHGTIDSILQQQRIRKVQTEISLEKILNPDYYKGNCTREKEFKVASRAINQMQKKYNQIRQESLKRE